MRLAIWQLLVQQIMPEGGEGGGGGVGGEGSWVRLVAQLNKTRTKYYIYLYLPRVQPNAFTSPLFASKYIQLWLGLSNLSVENRINKEAHALFDVIVIGSLAANTA